MMGTFKLTLKNLFEEIPKAHKIENLSLTEKLNQLK